MAYQYKREPLTPDEANRLANACNEYSEKLVVWTLLDTGLRLTEFETLKKDNIDWQGHRLVIFGKVRQKNKTPCRSDDIESTANT